MRAIKAPFESPNWPTNLLWLTLAAVTNGIFVGQIGLLGWGTELLKQRAGLPGRPTPDINPQRLGDYITLGLWPFLVSLVVQTAAMLVLMVPLGFLAVIILAISAAADGEATFVVLLVLLSPVWLLLVVSLPVLTVPFVLRAMLTQDFQQAFDFGWARGFIKLMFWDIVRSALLFSVLGLLIVFAGIALFCIGQIPASGIVGGGAMHLLAQWYEVYLSRGGLPVHQPDTDELIDATILP